METTKRNHRDIPNRTDEQLKTEHEYLKRNLFSLSSPALQRYAQVSAELGRRGLIKYATYDA